MKKGHVLKLNALKQTDIQEAYGITIAPSNEIARPVLVHRIIGTGESTTHQYCRSRLSFSDHTLWLEVEEGRENRAHTQHKHQHWPELCRGDGKTELTRLNEL